VSPHIEKGKPPLIQLFIKIDDPDPALNVDKRRSPRALL
jgi:hypothetical protein